MRRIKCTELYFLGETSAAQTAVVMWTRGLSVPDRSAVNPALRGTFVVGWAAPGPRLPLPLRVCDWSTVVSAWRND